MSAFISASEIAFFGLKKVDVNDLNQKNAKVGKIVADLIKRPKKLLATILIFNNSINIGLVILSTIFVDKIEGLTAPSNWFFPIQLIVVTSLILLFGEILPKIYATKKGKKTALVMARPIMVLSYVFHALSMILISISNLFDKSFKQENRSISVDELSRVHKMVDNLEGGEQEQKMLEGILAFGNTEVKNAMKPRVDVVSLDINSSFTAVKDLIMLSGFSRVPVHENGFDNVKGVLYIKDLLPHINKGDEFEWVSIIRQPFFVPENKKLDDLLIEFQEKKIHLAVVVDEYGGSSGVITLEDVIEEIVGDMRDEFDSPEVEYSKLDNYRYVMEGKTQLKDFYRIIGIDGEVFEKNKGDSDTLAGFVLELKGDFPFKGEIIVYDNYTITIEELEKRRIKRVKVEIKH